MKKSLVAIFAVCSMALSASAQGTLVIDSGANFGNGSSYTATTGGLVWVELDPHLSGPVLETSDINLGVLWVYRTRAINPCIVRSRNTCLCSLSPPKINSECRIPESNHTHLKPQALTSL